ncbi:MAG: isoleucine--tRNA ligase [Acidobacteria bacterium]|nr:isoleucine--tRNA ligase [Acidobacteriota bacterium]
MNEKSIKDSLNLPKTEFPMRANLPQREPEILKKWEQDKIYDQIRKERSDAPSYILHDGPPYANGSLHMGHVLNKILKDFVVKSKNMTGFNSPYVPGWDCHGLPIELKVEREVGKEIKENSIAKFLVKCREYAQKYVDIQKEEFIRLGVFGEWDNPYLTMTPQYEADTIRELGMLYSKNYIYKGKKSILWCIDCATALASAEVEYHDHKSNSIYVKFPVDEDLSDIIPELKGKKVFAVIWTTTPWTIPANLGITAHPDYDYVAVEVGDEVYLMAEYLSAPTLEDCGIKDYKKIATFKGKILDRRNARHPFYDRNSLFMIGDHVTLDAGTGLVHTAPGHGVEDYIIGMEYGLDIYNPVDETGHYEKDLERFAGLQVFEANKVVNDYMRSIGALLGEGEITHSYPHCWRCENPVIFRATEQWFVNIDHDDLRKKALEQIEKTQWIPEWGQERIQKMIANRPDWCISRQRVWGTPMTVFYCNKCGEVIASEEIFEHVAKIVEKEQIDAWHLKDAKVLAPAGTKCPKCGSDDFRKENNIVDVWFDSGVSSRVVLGKRDDLPWPSDLYLEGSDQHRGWFHSSLLTSTAIMGRAPYNAVLTHGFTIDSEGRPLSKRLGNYPPLPEQFEQYGAEILRLWVAMVDYREDMRYSQEILSGAVEAYKKIRNTIRFALGNLYDFNPDKDSVPFEEMTSLERYGMSRLDQTIEKVRQAYDKFEYTVVFHTLENYCIVDLSSFMFHILKDRLYTAHPEDKKRRSAQTAVFYIVRNLIELLAPIMSFTAEEAWQYLPDFKGKLASPHLMMFPENGKYKISDKEQEDWDLLLKIRDDVQKALELAREQKTIGHSLDARVRITGDEKIKVLLKENEDLFREIMVLSQFEVSDSLSEFTYRSEDIKNLTIQVVAASGEKCERCWNYSEEVGKHTNYPTVCERCAPVLEKL